MAGFGAVGFGDSRPAGSAAAAAGGDPEQTRLAAAATPPTLELFAKECKVLPEVAASVATALGGDVNMDLEDFAFVDEADITEIISKLKVNEVDATGFQKAQAQKLYRKAKLAAVSAGVPLPGVVVKAPGATPPSTETSAAGGPVVLKSSAYLDQSSEATFALLSPEEVRSLRMRYFDLFGEHPANHARPTDEQLSALKARLESGRVPFVDFAVFGPFDDHEAKLRKFTDQVFVGGVLQTRLLHGPSSFADWAACYDVFKSAMIMLSAARPGVLDKYAEGIRQLWHTYGDWAVIHSADVAMRSREWTIVFDEMKQKPEVAQDSMPWNTIIAQTAFGEVTGPRAHWWWLHVQAPMSQKSKAQPGAVVARLEQRAGNIGPPAAATVKGGSKRKNQINKAKAKANPNEICFGWNYGTCTAPVCPDGRRHVCRKCEGNHKVSDCPKNKGKGGGKGDSGKGDGAMSGSRKRKAGKAGGFKK